MIVAIKMKKGEMKVKGKKIFTNPVMVVLIAVFCNILWGSAFPFVKRGYALFHITDAVSDKLLFAGTRFFLAGILLLVGYLALNRRVPKLHKDNLKNVVELGIVQTTVQYIFFYIGLSNTTGTNGSIVNSSSVFLSVILSHFIYANDKITLKKAIGCMIGFGGVLFCTLGQGSAKFSFTGEGFIVISGFTSAMGAVISKKATQRDESWVVTAYNLAMGGAILIAAGFLMGGRLWEVSLEGSLVLLYLSMLSAAAFTLWAMLLTYNNISKICIYNFVIPIAGTLLSGLILKETIFKKEYIVSLLLVSGGIFLVNSQKHDKIVQ
ncbi:DMT family transporter [[Clostridium] polysaccharolyticum]|uniref:Permease of the drug/metabolite transporter (DMT) superfamily n=1 Tax=[Clostridium] polysaccharolyticum TaxID=29364 RepID=A0A1I0CZP0_9FIRM|nr:DMT family transporter [[Clostridium] polysaccharolyticum]SET25128.1 Permease of the drug/metabolite transporter (DMT) superfamily [[Clostridium] polysaccharolyticum]